MNKHKPIHSEASDAVAAPTAMRARARILREAGGIVAALASGALPKIVEVSLSEALVLGLLRQGVRTYFAIFGHGSTDLAEVLRIYDEEGVTRTLNCRNEVAMAHAATALAWVYGETPAVITSIGPGAMQAMAGSLTAASNGVGVYHIYGDETTFGEGYNMQQIPKEEQALYGRLTSLMGQSYVLHTPEAIREAMRRGALRVNHPYKPGPFYLLLPINKQPAMVELNLAALPNKVDLAPMAIQSQAHYARAAELIAKTARVTIKAGGGTRAHGEAMRQLAEAAGASVVLSPGALGVLPDAHPQNMHVGGSKGSISGNYAMEKAELVIVIGSRAVCQADCSGVGYKSADMIININGDLADAHHYSNTLALPGDIGLVASALVAELGKIAPAPGKAEWLEACAERKREWATFKQARYDAESIVDPVWARKVLTQPAAIKIVDDFARRQGAAKFFDAGDVQANGFQVVEDDRCGDTYTDTGASYMGFAASALLSAAAAKAPRYAIAFCGDGSFMMNPQILIDAVEHHVHATVVIFDNRRMAAITGLQRAQYAHEFRTHDRVAVDYVRLASAVEGVQAIFGGYGRSELNAALETAKAHRGLSVVHVPVYAGEDPLGGLGAFGQWNVGNWCEDVQSEWVNQDF